MEMENVGKLLVQNKDRETIFTFNLKMGVNIVGRTSTEKKSTIEISGDDYLGRQHFTIEVSMDTYNRLRYILSDNNSLNGTKFYCDFLKTQSLLKKEDEIEINKGDRIRAGNTYFELEIIDNVGGEAVTTRANWSK